MPRNGELDLFKLLDPPNGSRSTAGSEEQRILAVLPAGSPMTIRDLRELRELRDDLFRICQRAKERGVKIIIDAEHRSVHSLRSTSLLTNCCSCNIVGIPYVLSHVLEIA